jgi:hypothetical protein
VRPSIRALSDGGGEAPVLGSVSRGKVGAFRARSLGKFPLFALAALLGVGPAVIAAKAWMRDRRGSALPADAADALRGPGEGIARGGYMWRTRERLEEGGVWGTIWPRWR